MDMLQWGQFLSNQEPNLDVLAAELSRRIAHRTTPLNFPPVPIHNASPIEIKKMLLQITPETLQLITDDNFETLLESHPNLPDTESNYPGVYAGLYVHADGTSPTVADVIRFVWSMLFTTHGL
jgi:hypothetical protein